MQLRFFLPAPELAPFVSTYYLMEKTSPEGVVLEDYLHPEWANVRIGKAARAEAGNGAEPLRPVSQLVVAGPTSQATHFAVHKGSFWGIGLLPLGWMRFVTAPAHKYADRFVDGEDDPAFAGLAPLTALLADDGGDPAMQVDAIDRHLLSFPDRTGKDAAAVSKVHAALIDPEVGTVAQLAANSGMALRTLERFSRNVFGFSPKILLRRQRFLRSLAQFMLDPSLSWLSTLDYHYHDQAHFVRDFRRFMTMSPSEYRQLPHPILAAAARARAEAAGAAVQALHQPGTAGGN